MSLRTTWATEETLSHKTSKNLIHKRNSYDGEAYISTRTKKIKNGVRFLCQYALIDWIDNKDTQLGL